MEVSTAIEETLQPTQTTRNMTASSSVMLQYEFDRQYSQYKGKEDDTLLPARSEIFAPQKAMIKAVGRDRKPTLLFKGTNYSQSMKQNGELQLNKRNFLIVGNKINLQLRDKKEGTQRIVESYRNCEGASQRSEEDKDYNENWIQETVTSQKCRIQIENGCEGVEAQVKDEQDSFLEGKYAQSLA